MKIEIDEFTKIILLEQYEKEKKFCLDNGVIPMSLEDHTNSWILKGIKFEGKVTSIGKLLNNNPNLALPDPKNIYHNGEN